MANRIIIDNEKCVGCGQCVRDCVAGFLEIKDGKAVTHEKGCIACGHCYAVCPAGAVSMPDYEIAEESTTAFTEIDSEVLLRAMKSRRSIRQFKAQSIEQEKIDMIIEAGRYAPTGSNAQDVAFTILGSKQDEIETQCVELFRKGASLASPLYAGLKNMKIDDRFFFKGAPLVIVVSAKSAINAGLAASYMETMAASLGLGVLYSGFFVICTALNAKVKKALELPTGNKVQACMVIGYPDVNYKRIPPRNPAKVKVL